MPGPDIFQLGDAKPERNMRLVSCLVALAVVAAPGCGGGGNSNVNAVQQPLPQVSVKVFPSKATTPVGTVQPFTAVVYGASSAVKWTASAGTIDESGNYKAPLTVPAGGTAKVTATTITSPAVSGSAMVTVTTQAVTLSITPSTATVKAGFFQTYAAVVGGTTNVNATWSVTDFPGDLTFPGFIAGGIYSAPAPVLTPDSFLISAVSSADPTKTALASVSVIPLENQEEQSLPIKLGTSGVNATVGDCCSGTLGALLVDQKGRQYILSNNHVIGKLGRAKPGEAIVQPGYLDTLCDFSLPNTVAHFTFAAPILMATADAAIAQVVTGAVDPQGEIIGLGGIASDGSYIPAAPANTTVKATVGMPVAKSGRTTGLSCGTVLGVSGGVCVDYPSGCGNTTALTVCFSGQVIMGSLVQPGDSGSLIVDADTAQPMGLVVGSTADGRFTSANPVMDILSALKTGTGLTFNFVGGGQHPVSCASARAAAREDLIAESIAIPSQEIAHAMDVQKRYERTIIQDAAVIGTAIGNSDVTSGHASLLLFLERGKVHGQLPSTLEGVPVRLMTTGRFQATTSSPSWSTCSRDSASPR
jgi:hypothetical protein